MNYKIWIVEILQFITTFIPAIILSLAISGKLDDKINLLKIYPYRSVAAIILIYILLYCAYKYAQYKFRRDNENTRIKELENSLKESKNKNTFYEDLISAFKQQICAELENELCKTFRNLKLNHQHRITVYTYTKGVFFSIGRYSENTSLSKFGRIAIDNKEEILFKIWNNGEDEIRTMNPSKERNMKTKKIAIFFLYEKNDNLSNKDRFGVVVFESTNKKDKILSDSKKNELQEAAKNINEYFYKSWNIKQDLNIAIREEL